MPNPSNWQSIAEVNAWMSFAEGGLSRWKPDVVTCVGLLTGLIITVVHALPITYASWFVDDVHADVKQDLISKLCRLFTRYLSRPRGFAPSLIAKLSCPS